mmetsp:Transcript_72042/g.154248  ORF Transcript_72042/g.154248 Transcript_72042/m.154248 type:complete len:303 (-) Transcript_72042:113-1021(-)
MQPGETPTLLPQEAVDIIIVPRAVSEVHNVTRLLGSRLLGLKEGGQPLEPLEVDAAVDEAGRELPQESHRGRLQLGILLFVELRPPIVNLLQLHDVCADATHLHHHLEAVPSSLCQLLILGDWLVAAPHVCPHFRRHPPALTVRIMPRRGSLDELEGFTVGLMGLAQVVHSAHVYSPHERRLQVSSEGLQRGLHTRLEALEQVNEECLGYLVHLFGQLLLRHQPQAQEVLHKGLNSRLLPHLLVQERLHKPVILLRVLFLDHLPIAAREQGRLLDVPLGRSIAHDCGLVRGWLQLRPCWLWR